MEILAKNRKLKVSLEQEAVRKKRFGVAMSKKLRVRLGALRAAESLATFWPPKSGPERCHELKGNLAGVFSIDLVQPYRLLFRPIEENPPEDFSSEDRSNEQDRWASITVIEILEIEDTHG